MVWLEALRISARDRIGFSVLEDCTFFILEHKNSDAGEQEIDPSTSTVLDQWPYRILMRTRDEFHLCCLARNLPEVRKDHWTWLKEEILSKVRGKLSLK
jgi:hypothetical protein